MPLPDYFCKKCIWKYVPKDTKLDALEHSEGTCDHCGEEGPTYGIPGKTLSDFLEIGTKIFVRCIRCGESLHILGSEPFEMPSADLQGIRLIVERHICEDVENIIEEAKKILAQYRKGVSST